MNKMMKLAERKATEWRGPALVIDTLEGLAVVPGWMYDEQYLGAEVVAKAEPTKH